jgi:Ala-tRNA(Pro) deacylase
MDGATSEATEGLAEAQARLWARLAELGIRTRTVEHPPVFTVAEAKALRGELPGGHCKSLFLRDKRRHWLLVALEDQRIDLKALRAPLGAGNLSFASPERLQAMLGVTPGSVTPFALINARGEDGGREPTLTVVLDRAMLAFDPLNYHPLRNDQTTAIAPADLVRFIRACGYEPVALDLAAEPPQPAALPQWP